MSRCLIANLVPREICSTMPVSEASTIFCWNMINGGCFQKTIGLVHTTIIEPIHLQDTEQVDFVQSRIFPHRGLGRIFNNLCDSIIAFNRSRKATDIWYYNLEWTQIISYFLLKIFRKNIYVIVADFTPPSHKISLATLTKKLIEHSDGIISLSSRSVFHHHNQKCIAGIVSLEELEERSKMPNPRNNKFLFSGGLQPIHGIDLAIEVFKELPEAELFITGKNLSFDVSKISNIHYLGYLSRMEYEELFKKVSFCLSFRNPDYPENYNNFPSKILEFLMYNIVISIEPVF